MREVQKVSAIWQELRRSVRNTRPPRVGHSDGDTARRSNPHQPAIACAEQNNTIAIPGATFRRSGFTDYFQRTLTNPDLLDLAVSKKRDGLAVGRPKRQDCTF